MANSSMSNNASSLHGRDDHAPLFALPRLSLGTPTARHPYHFFYEVLPHQSARQRALKTYKLNP